MSDTEGAAREVERDPSLGWYVGAVVLVLFAALAFSVRTVLSPLVLYVLFLYVAWPWISRPICARLAVVATLITGLWLLDVTGLLMAPFILAGILAYVVDPVVDRLEVYLPRPAAIGLLALPLLGALVVVALVLVPAVANQITQLISSVPEYVNAVEGWIEGLRRWAVSLGIPGVNDRSLPALREIDERAVTRYLQERRAEIGRRGLGAVLGLGRGLGTVLTLAGYLVVLPVLTYYVLRDWDRIRGVVASLIPEARRDSLVRYAAQYDELLSRYLRGQLLLSLIVGLLIGVGFWLVDFPYALLLGLVAGVLNIVPYVGLLASLVVAVIVAVFSGTLLASLAKVAVVFGVEQLIEGAVGPKIVGQSVGLHPVWVLLALALFSFFFGFVGLLIAVPAAVLIKLLVEAAVERYRESGWFERGVRSP